MNNEITWVEEDFDDDEEGPKTFWRGALRDDDWYEELVAWVFEQEEGGWYYNLTSPDYVFSWEEASELCGWAESGLAATFEEAKSLAEAALRNALAFVIEWDKLHEASWPKLEDCHKQYTQFLFKVKKPALLAWHGANLQGKVPIRTE